jgi:putative chitinase
MIKEEKLKAIAPGITDDKVTLYVPLLNKWMPYYSINTKLRQAAFLAQILHESGCFRYTEEIASGEKYDTGKLAEKLGNTLEKDGDGEMYKGRGLIMITGKNNYKALAKGLGVDFVKQPELLKEPEYAVQSAAWWWTTRNLNILAERKEFKQITHIINGGYNGYPDRLGYYTRAMSVL